MEHHEYPKALYRQGEYAAVAGFDAEQALRAEGWMDWHEDQLRVLGGEVTDPRPAAPAQTVAEAAPRAKGGRPRKGAQ